MDQDVYLRSRDSGKFRATGSGAKGAVLLRGARMARLECDGAWLFNESGPALRADSIQVDQRAFLHEGFEARGSEKLGTVRLNGARLGIFAGVRSTIYNSCGPALVANAMVVERGFLLGAPFAAEGAGDEGVLQLTGTRIGGQFKLDTGCLSNRNGKPLIDMDGLTYAGIPQGPTIDRWLELLPTGKYAAQPYQQLAGAYRAAGRDEDARRILIAQRDDEIKAGVLSRRSKHGRSLLS